MSDVFRKLQLKDQERIGVLGAPSEFEEHLDALPKGVVVSTRASKKPCGFVLAFVKSRADIATVLPKVVGMLEDDALLWFAYPKKSSKRYVSDISRDDGWQPLGAEGFEGVRQIAIDDDWSALRFRRVEHIKDLKRDPRHALSAKGKRRAEEG